MTLRSSRALGLIAGSAIALLVLTGCQKQVKDESAPAPTPSISASTGAFLRAVEAQTAATGKTLVVIRQIYAGERYSGEMTPAWRAASYAPGLEGIVDVGSAEEAVAAIEPRIAAQRDPAQLELLVVEG